jgi:hypothetical protein
MSTSGNFEAEKPVAMIDRFYITPGNQQAVYTLVTQDYAAHVAPRGVRLKGAWLTPPFERPGVGSELFAIWEYATLDTLWGARMAEEDDSGARELWAKLDLLTESRSRQIARAAPMHVLAPEENNFVPNRAESSRHTILFVRPAKPLAEAEQTAWVSAAEAVAKFPNIVISRAGFHQESSFMPGHFTWDIGVRAALDLTALLNALPGKAEIVDRVELAPPLDAGLREPGLSGTKRTVLLRSKSNLNELIIEAFEQTIAATPRYITGILNWRLSRVADNGGAMGWTHCFEQEVADVSIFSGDYLNHPYHWAIVERLFHPDAPERVAVGFSHTLYPIKWSVLAEMQVSL